MQIVVSKVGAPYKEGKFFKLDFEYSRDGKPLTRKLVAVGESKEVFNVLKDSKPGEMYEIKLVKDGDYWNWTNASKLEGSVAAPVSGASSGSRTVGITDSQRQRLIVRQSSVATAVALAGPTEKNLENILDMADEICDWVFEKVDVPVKEPQLKDDIPF